MRYYKVLKVVVYIPFRIVLKYGCIKYKCSVKILVLILSSLKPGINTKSYRNSSKKLLWLPV